MLLPNSFYNSLDKFVSVKNPTIIIFTKKGGGGGIEKRIFLRTETHYKKTLKYEEDVLSNLTSTP